MGDWVKRKNLRFRYPKMPREVVFDPSIRYSSNICDLKVPDLGYLIDNLTAE